MLSTSLNYIYGQRNLRFPTKLYLWLSQDDCQIAVSTDAGLTVRIESGFADKKYCSNLVLLWIFIFLFVIVPILRIDVQPESCLTDTYTFIFCTTTGLVLQLSLHDIKTTNVSISELK